WREGALIYIIAGASRKMVRDKMEEAPMMSKLRVFLLLAAVTVWALRSMNVADLLAFVKSQIQMKGDDRATADFILHKVRLTEKLEDRTVEDLQGQGAGPKTVAALRKLSGESASLPAPPPPLTAAP